MEHRENSKRQSDLEGGFDEEKCSIDNCLDVFLCRICLGIPRNAVLLSDCQHVYCEKCIRTTEPVNSDANRFSDFFKCAVCRGGYLRMIRYRDWDPLLRRVFQRIRVKCRYCQKPGEVIDIGRHELMDCPQRPVLCKFPGCDFECAATEILKHESDCTHQLIFCRTCRLPRKILDESHNCVAKLTEALTKEQSKKPPRRPVKFLFTQGVPGDPVEVPGIYYELKQLLREGRGAEAKRLFDPEPDF